MTEEFPDTWVTLKYPGIRGELLQVLDELTLDDPISQWSGQRSQGWCVGFDEVVHFLFDDHDFDERDIGFSLLDGSEVQAFGALKTALGLICDDLPEGNDEQSVSHPSGPQIRKLAAAAAQVLRSN